MRLPQLIESFGAVGARLANHPVTCNCAECRFFLEMADSIANTPTEKIREAVRELAERRVVRRKAA